MRGSTCAAAGDPVVDLALEHGQRQRAGHQHLGVEVLEVEAAAERLLGLGAQLEDLELADLVGERLAGNGDVALDLGGDLGLGSCRYCRACSRIACSRVQPLAWMPVSTTSRIARSISSLRPPKR